MWTVRSGGTISRLDAAHAHFFSIGAAQHEAKAATHFQIDLAGRERPAARSVPALEQVGLGERFEDQMARRVEDSRQDNSRSVGVVTFNVPVFFIGVAPPTINLFAL